MRRTEQVQGLRLMKFEEIYERTTARRLSEPPQVYRRVKLSKDEPYDTTQTYPVLYG